MKKRIINGKVYTTIPEEQERTCLGCAFFGVFDETHTCPYIQPECKNGMIFKALETEKAKKTNLKPFNLEKAKAGKPVCTRDGRKVRIICFDRNSIQPIVALIKNFNGEESVNVFFKDGHSLSKNNEVEADLIMLPEKKEGWVNVYRDCDGANITKDDNIYSSKDAAIASAKIIDRDNYVATTIIKWEELTMWIARDRDGLLYIYENKPKKALSGWVVKCGWFSNLPSYALPEIKWEDEEPQELVLKPIKEELKEE